MSDSENVRAVDVYTIWHNRADYVKESLMSIITQTFKDYRIIAVDDGSTDCTYEELSKMIPVASNYGVELEVLRQKNQGFTNTLISTINRYPNSRYFAIHGAGDISLPRRLKKQFELHQLCRSSVVGAWVDVIGIDGRLVKSRKSGFIQDRNINRFIIPRPGTHGAAMVDKDIYYRVGGYRALFEYAQDADLWIRMSREAPIRNVQEVLYKKKRINGCVALDKEKSKLQRMYSTFAVQCEIERERDCSRTPNLEEVGDVGNAVSQWLLFRRSLKSATFYPLSKIVRRFFRYSL